MYYISQTFCLCDKISNRNNLRRKDLIWLMISEITVHIPWLHDSEPGEQKDIAEASDLMADRKQREIKP
jgi:hypothetical protein